MREVCTDNMVQRELILALGRYYVGFAVTKSMQRLKSVLRKIRNTWHIRLKLSFVFTV